MPHKSDKLKSIDLHPTEESLPCTDLAFLPKQGERKKILASYASGFVRIWQYNIMGKAVLIKNWREVEHRYEENGELKFNQILCLSLSLDGKRFVTGGSDTVVRSYTVQSSLEGRLLIPSLHFSVHTEPSASYNYHTNRITALSYHPRGAKDVTYSHIFVSSSWDGTVQGWDDRICGSLWQNAGTHVAGADGLCIDPVRNFVITGSYKHDKMIAQVWDARDPTQPELRNTMGNIATPLSTISQEVGSPSIQVYVAHITPDNQTLIFGGTNINMLKILNAATLRPVGIVGNLPNGIYSAASCVDPADKKRVIVAFTNATKVHLLLIDPRQTGTVEIT